MKKGRLIKINSAGFSPHKLDIANSERALFMGVRLPVNTINFRSVRKTSCAAGYNQQAETPRRSRTSSFHFPRFFLADWNMLDAFECSSRVERSCFPSIFFSSFRLIENGHALNEFRAVARRGNRINLGAFSISSRLIGINQEVSSDFQHRTNLTWFSFPLPSSKFLLSLINSAFNKALLFFPSCFQKFSNGKENSR